MYCASFRVSNCQLVNWQIFMKLFYQSLLIKFHSTEENQLAGNFGKDKNSSINIKKLIHFSFCNTFFSLLGLLSILYLRKNRFNSEAKNLEILACRQIILRVCHTELKCQYRRYWERDLVGILTMQEIV